MLELPMLPLFVLSQIFGLGAVACILGAVVRTVQNTEYPTADMKNFQYHPFLMPAGFLYLFGLSIIIYRLLRNLKKIRLKIIHAIIHLAAFCFVIAGSVLAFKAMGWSIGTMHSLFGFITIVLFALQWIFSFFVFLWPTAPLSVRAPGIKIHVVLGILIFIMAMVSTMTGLNYKTGTSRDTTTQLYTTGGFFYFIYFALILYMVTKPAYKREEF